MLRVSPVPPAVGEGMRYSGDGEIQHLFFSNKAPYFLDELFFEDVVMSV